MSKYSFSPENHGFQCRTSAEVGSWNIFANMAYVCIDTYTTSAPSVDFHAGAVGDWLKYKNCNASFKCVYTSGVPQQIKNDWNI